MGNPEIQTSDDLSAADAMRRLEGWVKPSKDVDYAALQESKGRPFVTTTIDWHYYAYKDAVTSASRPDRTDVVNRLRDINLESQSIEKTQETIVNTPTLAQLQQRQQEKQRLQQQGIQIIEQVLQCSFTIHLKTQLRHELKHATNIIRPGDLTSDFFKPLSEFYASHFVDGKLPKVVDLVAIREVERSLLELFRPILLARKGLPNPVSLEQWEADLKKTTDRPFVEQSQNQTYMDIPTQDILSLLRERTN